MLTLILSQLPVSEASFRAGLTAYRDAVAEHALTVGIPAPIPEYDVFRKILAADGDGEFILVDDTPPPPPPPPDLTLAERKTAAKKRIDAKAEQVRAKYLTAAPLQSATYVEKAREAREFKAAGYPSAPFAPATWPYVDAEMRAVGDTTPTAACDRILAEAAQYAQVKGAAIEYERRHGKIAVDAAGTSAAVSSAEATAMTALSAL